MLEEYKKLSFKYNISLENVLSIALNRYGVIIEDFKDSRIRFNLNFLDSNIENFYAVCVNTYAKSPFKLKGNTLYLDNEKIGKVRGIELDTCTSTYFRNNKKVITFNSNSRSKCTGCKFCGTYSLKEDDRLDFKTKEKIQTYFYKLLKDNDIMGMSKIENVTICTGCFSSEDELIKHLLLVNESFKEMGYKGSINYIGSQLRNYQNIKELSKSINNFGLYLTIEKFLEREKYMRAEKANLTIEKAKELLSYCTSLGITTTFLYILGLEDLKTIEKYFHYLSQSINKFPIVQVFQNYTIAQENYRCEQAKTIEYYLQAKKIISKTFNDMQPKLWECFRGLYSDEDITKKEMKLCLKN